MEINKMLEVEEKYGLLEKKVGGFQYWIYCRYEIWYNYIIPLKRGVLCQTPSGGESLSSILGDAWSLFKCSITNSSVKRKHYDICIMDHERRQQIGSYFECIYTEFLSEYFNNTFTLERTYRHRHLQPVKTNNLIYIDAVEVRSNLYSLLNRKCKTASYRKLMQRLKDDLKEPIHELGKQYDISISLERVCDTIAKFYFIYQIKVPYFSKILERYQPKVIVEVVGYNMDCMIMNELTHDTPIPTVEFAHGMIGREHLAYGYSDQTGKKCIKQFAKNLFVFSGYFIQETKLPETRVWKAGYPFLEVMKKKYPPKSDKSSAYTILFISQLVYGKELARTAVACEKLLKDRGVHIIYKLHPKEYPIWKERYPELYASEVEVIDTLEVNIYQCFSRSDVQVGGNSTATFEGLSYYLPTYIINYPEIGEAMDLCNDGVASIFNSPEELVQLIEKNRGVERKKYCIWEENAVDTYVQGITELLHGELQ